MRTTAAAAGLMLFVGLATARAQTPTFKPGITTGTIHNTSITEASGLVASRTNANVLWTHNDSGHPAQIFPMTTAGVDLGTYTISGAGSTDWEDIAIGPGPVAGLQYIYVADTGDNNAVRTNVAVYRVPEPAVSAAQAPATISLSGAAKFTFVYPDGARDAESMFVDPISRDIYIISKRDTIKHLYRASFPQSTTGTSTLEKLLEFPTDSTWLTAADISQDGERIIVRSTDATSGRMYIRPPGGTIADAFATTPIVIPLVAEAQGEAIAFDSLSRGYYTTSEGLNAPIHYFALVPEPSGGTLIGATLICLTRRRQRRPTNRSCHTSPSCSPSPQDQRKKSSADRSV
jgi:hypothetical protein